MRLQKLNNITIVFLVLITSASLFGSFSADYYQQLTLKTSEIRWQSLSYADQLLAGSKFLTNAVRSFAATGDSKYQQAYNDEVYKNRSRDKALEGLRALGTPQQELALIEEAKLMSDTLIDLENQAFAAGNAGNLALAVELVYGKEYQQALQRIYEPILRFRQELQRRTDAEVAASQQQMEQKRYSSKVANIGSYVVVLAIVMLVYQRTIIRPIVKLSAVIQQILQGDHDSHIAYQDNPNEIGELARSLEQYRQVTRAMDAQNWVETNIGKVVATIQQARTEAELGRGLLSYISPLLDIGYAALYVHEPLKNRLSLVAAYGSQPAQENSGFAVGESLVGQCAQEKAEIVLSDLPDGYIRIRSALGDAKPKYLYLQPVLLQGRVLGVVELAVFRAFADHERTFINELMSTLAMTMEVLSHNLQTRKLLQETQEQAERMEKQAALLEEQTIELEAQQAELKETEAWYRNIIESAPQGMLVGDESGNIILCNPAAEALFGYTAGELIGSPLDILLPGTLRSEYALLLDNFLASGGDQETGQDMVIGGLNKQGQEFYVAVGLSLLPAQGSHDKCIFISVREADSACTLQTPHAAGGIAK